MRTKVFLFVLLSVLCLVTVWAQPFDSDIRQTADYKQGATWIPVLLKDTAATTRGHLGLGWSALTNTNAATTLLGLTNNTLVGTNLRLNTATNFDLGGVTGSLAVEAQGGNHAIAARASDEADGAAFYGWSESGAPAIKMVQSNNFTSPNAVFWRAGTGDYSSPQVLIAGSATNGTNIAFAITNASGARGFSVNWNGNASRPKAALINSIERLIDWNLSETFYIPLVAPTAFIFTNSADGQTIRVRVSMGLSTNHTATWPTSGSNDVKWSGGTEPTQTPSTNGVDIYTFVNINGTIYGSQITNAR
jgi:hypothetical protein